jgi:hypothetical protein
MKKNNCSSLCGLPAATKAVSSDSVKLGKYILKAGGCQQNILPFAGISGWIVRSPLLWQGCKRQAPSEGLYIF